MSLARPLNGGRLTRLDFSLFFFCTVWRGRKLSYIYPTVIYFSVGQLNEVIVCVWSAACYKGNKIKARAGLKKARSPSGAKLNRQGRVGRDYLTPQLINHVVFSSATPPWLTNTVNPVLIIQLAVCVLGGPFTSSANLTSTCLCFFLLKHCDKQANELLVYKTAVF